MKKKDYQYGVKAGQPFAATIGVFDGVHLGHRYLIDQLKAEAESRHLRTMVVTFERHPRQVVQPEWTPQLLTTAEEKVELLLAAGVDSVTVLPFNKQTTHLSARQFMEQVLAGTLNVRLLLTGYDNRFGHDRTEGFADYVAYGRLLGIDVVAGRALTVGSVRASSSHIRSLLLNGQVDEAARCLGRPYTIGGTVVHGRQIGRQMGFPTANLQPDDPHKVVPGKGAYAVRAQIGRKACMPAMTNIGTRPTFSGSHTTIETHVLGNVGDCYGKAMRLSFVERLRDERPFHSADELRQQLADDKARTLALLTRMEAQEAQETSET